MHLLTFSLAVRAVGPGRAGLGRPGWPRTRSGRSPNGWGDRGSSAVWSRAPALGAGASPRPTPLGPSQPARRLHSHPLTGFPTRTLCVCGGGARVRNSCSPIAQMGNARQSAGVRPPALRANDRDRMHLAASLCENKIPEHGLLGPRRYTGERARPHSLLCAHYVVFTAFL